MGIIGTGNMGSILLEAFVDAQAISDGDITVYNRTPHKAKNLQKQFSGITIAPDLEYIVSNNNLLFVCVKPGEMPPLFRKMAGLVNSDQCIVSITSPVSVSQIESVVSCNVARFIPSITNKVLEGVSLLTFGDRCDGIWRNKIKELAEAISEGIEIDNQVTRVSSDIVSCGPAFFSFLAQEFIDAAVQVSGVDKATATVLTEKMIIGFGELLRNGGYSLETLQQKVCVKGGITGEGIAAMGEDAEIMFKRLFEATHAKFDTEVDKIQEQFRHDY
ncbi:MAG: late competence protein ComER [Bacillus sp. (in: firmicutes)]